MVALSLVDTLFLAPQQHYASRPLVDWLASLPSPSAGRSGGVSIVHGRCASSATSVLGCLLSWRLPLGPSRLGECLPCAILHGGSPGVGIAMPVIRPRVHVFCELVG